jgi:hypothetical protein
MRIYTLVSVLLLFGCTACQNDSSGESQSDTDATIQMLQGRWELLGATRNGKPTESLDGAFFEFMENGKLASNLGGSREEMQYEVQGKTIQQRGGRMDADFQIDMLIDTLLVLDLVLNSTPFKLRLGKEVMAE